MLLRWEAGEQNRRMFEIWETAQLVMAMAVFFVLLFGSTEGKYSLALSPGAAGGGDRSNDSC